jgi:hypothetical protein
MASTICVAGWSSRVRPPESVTEPIKRERMRAYSLSVPLNTMELDHLVPISLGGATTVANLWPEPLQGPDGAHVKDRLEDRLHALVCDRQVLLDVAQRAIADDWVAAYRQYVGPIG